MHVDVNGITLHYEIHGKGEPLLWLHGGTGCGADWAHVFREPPDGFQLIAPDLRGHGQSACGTGAMTFRQMALDVIGLLEQSLRFLPRGDIEVVRRLDTSLPPVSVDPNLLHQALLNILVNARQAMPNGGRLTIETRILGGNGRPVQIRIADTGIGIPADQLLRIFQPFFTTKAQGTGLGLAITARVVEEHGGRITVESAVGKGTTFTIALPTAPTNTPPIERRSGGTHVAQSPGR